MKRDFTNRLQNHYDDCIVSMAIRGTHTSPLEPRLWEELRRRLQRIWREATGEHAAIIEIKDNQP